MRRVACLAAWLALAWLIPAGPAWAQAAYKCVQGGSVRYSDRPCEAEARGQAVMPLAKQAQSLADAPPHWAYMGPACRRLAESIRRLNQQAATSDAPQLHQRLADQQEQYAGQCEAEEYQARERLAEQARAQGEQQRAKLAAQQGEEQRRAATLEQCNEMRRIRDARKAQWGSMTPGERADLQRFEANFAARCQRLAPR